MNLPLLLLSLLVGVTPPHPSAPTRWQLAQHRSASHGCLDTTLVPTWRRGEQDIRSSNFTYGKKAELLEENGCHLRMYDVLISNKKMLTQIASRTNQRITAHDVRAPARAVGIILKRTARLLVISWLPGSVDVYRNTSLSQDSISNSALNGYVLASGRLACKTIRYCPRPSLE